MTIVPVPELAQASLAVAAAELGELIDAARDLKVVADGDGDGAEHDVIVSMQKILSQTATLSSLLKAKIDSSGKCLMDSMIAQDSPVVVDSHHDYAKFVLYNGYGSVSFHL